MNTCGQLTLFMGTSAISLLESEGGDMRFGGMVGSVLGLTEIRAQGRPNDEIGGY